MTEKSKSKKGARNSPTGNPSAKSPRRAQASREASPTPLQEALPDALPAASPDALQAPPKGPKGSKPKGAKSATEEPAPSPGAAKAQDLVPPPRATSRPTPASAPVPAPVPAPAPSSEWLWADPEDIADLANSADATGSVPDLSSLVSDEDEAPTSPPSTKEALAERIRELEARLDNLMQEASSQRRSTPSEPPASRPFRKPPPAVPSLDDGGPWNTARELFSSNFYMRKWGRLGMRHRSEEVDTFGFDRVYEEKTLPYLDFLYSKYFRTQTEGVDNIPDGRCLLVANHSGSIPLDGLMLKMAVKRNHVAARDVRWLTEDTIFHFPYLGSFANRLGAVRACQENAERLLKAGSLVAVFPEGVKGIGKLYKDRYKLQRFGRGGFVKLALRTQTPIVPVAIIGAEETNPMLAKVDAFNKLLGIPYFPITPTFPLLGPAGLLPAPTRWKFVFGKPLFFAEYGPEGSEDELLVNRLAERIRSGIQTTLQDAIQSRRSVWQG